MKSLLKILFQINKNSALMDHVDSEIFRTRQMFSYYLKAKTKVRNGKHYILYHQSIQLQMEAHSNGRTIQIMFDYLSQHAHRNNIQHIYMNTI